MIERDEDDDDDDDDEEEEETKMRVYVSSCVACLSSSRKGSSRMLRKYGRRLRLLTIESPTLVIKSLFYFSLLHYVASRRITTSSAQ